jgi:hypothetical protein
LGAASGPAPRGGEPSAGLDVLPAEGISVGVLRLGVLPAEG